MYALTLTLTTTRLTLSLLKDESTIDARCWRDEKNISEKLLPMVDDLLAVHRLFPKDIEAFHVASDLPAHYTAVQIAQSVARTLIWRGNET